MFWPLRAPTPPPLPRAERPSPWPGSIVGAPPENETNKKQTHIQLQRRVQLQRGSVCFLPGSHVYEGVEVIGL